MIGLGERIKLAADQVGGLDHLAPLLTDVSRRTLSDWANDKTEPRATSLSEIARITDVSLNWLVNGGTSTLDASAEKTPEAWSDLAHLPLFDIEASAGLGVPNGPAVQLGAIAFDPLFLRAQGARPDQCSIISASGDSMQPVIPDGSLLVVDHSQKEVRNGHIMVVNVGEDLLVKRIRRRLDGLIELISDNPAYAPETLGPDALAQLRVVGRVVYFCRVP